MVLHSDQENVQFQAQKVATFAELHTGIQYAVSSVASAELSTVSIPMPDKANVNGKRVSGHIKADKTCGRAVIIIHYSIILPQHFLYNKNISCTCQRPGA